MIYYTNLRPQNEVSAQTPPKPGAKACPTPGDVCRRLIEEQVPFGKGRVWGSSCGAMSEKSVYRNALKNMNHSPQPYHQTHRPQNPLWKKRERKPSAKTAIKSHISDREHTKYSILITQLPLPACLLPSFLLLLPARYLDFFLLFLLEVLPLNDIPRHFRVPIHGRRSVRITAWSTDLELCEGGFQGTYPFITAFNCDWKDMREQRVDNRGPFIPLRGACWALLLYLISAESVIFVCSGKSATYNRLQ